MFENYFTTGALFYQAMSCYVAAFALRPFQNKNEDTRKHRLRYAEIAVMVVVLNVIMMVFSYHYINFSDWSTALEAPACFLTCLILCRSMLTPSLSETFYISVWSYLLSNFTTQIIMPIVIEFPIGAYRTAARCILYVIFLLIVYFVSSKLIYPQISSKGRYRIDLYHFATDLLIIGFYFVFSNYSFLFILLGEKPASMSTMITVFRLIEGALCLSLLFLQSTMESRMKAENDAKLLQQIMFRQQEQYRMSRENIELINQKCHDIKYHLAAFEKFSEDHSAKAEIIKMKEAIEIYDTSIKTGNQVLDTILTEKSLYCREHQITMTCMANGEILSFIDNADLYSILGNAIDNAIESVGKQEDPEKRVIQIAVEEVKKTVLIRVRNFCDDELLFEEGIPVTTKKKQKGYHGFGLKSIRHTVEKYGGCMTCKRSGEAFTLQILFPE